VCSQCIVKVCGSESRGVRAIGVLMHNLFCLSLQGARSPFVFWHVPSRPLMSMHTLFGLTMDRCLSGRSVKHIVRSFVQNLVSLVCMTTFVCVQLLNLIVPFPSCGGIT
jgi:hypothetical protein